MKLQESTLLHFSESPSKQRRLRVSVSCDNYLSEAKFGIVRRDSIGSGSPHSTKGSPLRWAAKADELGSIMTSSMTAAGPQRDSALKSEQMLACQRSCSANQVKMMGQSYKLLASITATFWCLVADGMSCDKLELKTLFEINNLQNCLL